MIVQELMASQDRIGYLPKEELEAIARRLGVPLHRVHEVASFFPHFRLEPPRPVEVRVCRDMSCHLRGAPECLKSLEKLADEMGGEMVRVAGVSCLGRCDAPPAVTINDHAYWGGSPAEYRALVRRFVQARESRSPGPSPQHADSSPPGWKIDPYGGREAYEAARAFVAEPDADALLAKLREAELRGMGGAGVPAAQKWGDVRAAAGDVKYVVCNGDESEPGTFKDRELLLRTPHLIVEGMLLGALVVGARKGYVYIRHEYHEQVEAVRAAIKRAYEANVLGPNLLGTNRAFDLEVFVSPGGYICGEQSALIQAIEDQRAEPRNKPPLIETNGLFDKPTLLNNVETFAWVPSIAFHGGAWYSGAGVNGAKGRRFFSISGDLERPGVYEVPIGLTLRELIEDYAGGLPPGMTLKAVAPSGPSGGFLPARIPFETLPRDFRSGLPERFVRERLPEGARALDVLDLELDLDLFRKLGLMLGAGLVVYGQQANMVDQALVSTKFFRNESCGKCVPCRLGSQRLVEIGARLRGGRINAGELKATAELVGELDRILELTSICGLGAVAGKPLVSALTYFRGDLAAHLRPGGSGRPAEHPAERPAAPVAPRRSDAAAKARAAAPEAPLFPGPAEDEGEMWQL